MPRACFLHSALGGGGMSLDLKVYDHGDYTWLATVTADGLPGALCFRHSLAAMAYEGGGERQRGRCEEVNDDGKGGRQESRH